MRIHHVGATALLLTTLAAVPATARDRDRDESFRVTPNQIVDMADARIAQLKADLRLSPDQDRNWGAFQSALHDMAQRRADRLNKMREQRSAANNATAPATAAPAPAVNDPNAPRAAADPNARPRDDRDARRDDRDSRDRDGRDRDARRDDRAPDVAVDLRMQADRLADRADDYRKFADASGSLYGSLDDTQKRRFLAFVERNLMNDGDDGSRMRR